MDEELLAKKKRFRFLMLLFPIWLSFIGCVLAQLGLNGEVLGAVLELSVVICVLYALSQFALLFLYLAKESLIMAILLTGICFVTYSIFALIAIFFGGWAALGIAGIA